MTVTCTAVCVEDSPCLSAGGPLLSNGLPSSPEDLRYLSPFGLCGATLGSFIHGLR